MEPIPRIIDDPRPIKSIWYRDESGFEVGGRRGVTAIRAYEEVGEMANVTWFAVYRGGEITARVPAHMVTVVYVSTAESEE